MQIPDQAAPMDRRTLMAGLAPFQHASLKLSLWQFGSTMLAYLLLNAAMYALVPVSTWLVLALSLPAAGMVVRLFIIQHDCGHGSFFRARWANNWLGRLCSPVTFTPYAFWRRQHANHHACFNNLDRRDTGIDLYSTCATVEEYLAMPKWRRLGYRISRHPLLTQLVLPPIVFLVLYRLPFDTDPSWSRERHSVMLTDLTLLLVLGALVLAFGFGTVALVQFPIILIASIIGVWLFSVQHRFEAAQWARQAEWNPVNASLDGSSYLRLPRVLQWFTGNIGFHHIHHLSAKVPNYRLQTCHEARPELGRVTTLTFGEALLAPSFALWDEAAGRMTRFPRFSRRRATAQ